jgi:hypothetical protein
MTREGKATKPMMQAMAAAFPVINAGKKVGE